MEKRIGVKIKVFGQVDLKEFSSIDELIKEKLNGLSFPCEATTIADTDDHKFPLLRFPNGIIVSQKWLRTSANKDSLQMEAYRTKGIKGWFIRK